MHEINHLTWLSENIKAISSLIIASPYLAKDMNEFLEKWTLDNNVLQDLSEIPSVKTYFELYLKEIEPLTQNPTEKKLVLKSTFSKIEKLGNNWDLNLKNLN